ncbi:MAG: hypothetical protein IJB65_03425 [Clostridia bacterium]|nr:hypothetical protein [Clostridia bacterium]
MFKLFRMKKKPFKKKLPFDEEKAYLYRRTGIMTGGGCRIKVTPEDLLEVYSYPIPVPENECGMRDKGANIYFVGLKTGKATVELVYTYPTCPEDTESFTLRVTEDGRVTKAE